MKQFLDIFKQTKVIYAYKQAVIGKDYRLYEKFCTDLAGAIIKVQEECDFYVCKDAELYQIGQKLLIMLMQVQNIIPIIMVHGARDEDTVIMKLENSIERTDALIEQCRKCS